MSETEPTIDFSSTIVPFEQIPDTLTSYRHGALGIEIAGDRSLKHGEQAITVVPDLFALNSLLLAGGRWVTFAHLKDSVGFPYTSPNFTRRMNMLNDSLKELTGVSEGVERRGEAQSRVARISPEFTFREGRGAEENRWLQLGITGDDEKISFESMGRRREILGKMFQGFVNEKVVVHEMRRMHEESLRLRRGVEMPPEMVYEQLLRIEQAAATFLSSTSQEWTEAEYDILCWGTMAYHKLYMSVEPMLRGICINAGRYSAGQLTEDMLQGARLEVLKAILQFGHEGVLEEKARYFYAHCNEAIRGSISDTILESVTAHKHITHREYYLHTRISEAHWRLSQDGKDTALAQIVKEIGDPELTVEEVRKCIDRTQRGVLRPDALEKGWEYLPGSADFEETEDNRLLDNILFANAINQLFENPTLSPKEKIMVSLTYGVWSPSLRGHVVRNGRDGESFEYPSTQEEFNDVVEGRMQSYRRLADILPYSHKGINNIVVGALKKARLFLDNPL